MASPRERDTSLHVHEPPVQVHSRRGVPAAALKPPYARARRVISWLALGVAAAELIGWVVVGLTVARSAFFWLPLIASVLLVPLVAVGLGLRSLRRGIAWATSIAALAFAALAGVALATSDWAHSTVEFNVLWLLALVPIFVAYFAAFLAELSAFGRRWPHPPAE